jgi:pyruvate,water dikinase
MSWHVLTQFRDATVPKLDNLRRAAEAGLRVPPTWWLPAAGAASLRAPELPHGLADGPVIVRSGSPTEDGRATSNAGQMLSLNVTNPADFADAVRRVAAALPGAADRTPRGAVFVQPLVRAREGGVAFFDGFYYERTLAAGGNQELTAGQARGRVERGHLARGEAWSAWLEAVYAVFGEAAGGDRRLDVEFACDDTGFVLLQVRPALFPVRRNEWITQANVKETLGEMPSPWTVSVLLEASKDLSFLTTLEAAVGTWEETFFVELAERPWINLSLWFRWMDVLGMPRTFVTNLIGGVETSAADAQLIPARLSRLLPLYLWRLHKLVRKIGHALRALKNLDAHTDEASGLRELHRVTVEAWVLLIHTALAISGMCALLMIVRRALRLPGSARLVTQEMMEGYRKLAEVADPAMREKELDAWLTAHGHRGPRESDVARPRFAELRPVLLADLACAAGGPVPAAPAKRRWWGRRLLEWLCRPWYWIDEYREWFRDEAMRSLQRMRRRLIAEGARLTAAGELDAAEDVFWLRGNDLECGVPLRDAVAAARRRVEAVRDLTFPLTGTRDTILERVAQARRAESALCGKTLFPGIALGPAVREGVALKADELLALLRDVAEGKVQLGPETVLVVPSLEPSWAVLFPRVGGVVAEVGGELSHASILLREAGKPAVVNCAGIFRRVTTGDRLRLDGVRGVVEILTG